MSLKSLTKKELYPIAIKNISKMNKKNLIANILDFEKKKPYKNRCKPYVCKGKNLIETDDFISCSECFSFSIKP